MRGKWSLIKFVLTLVIAGVLMGFATQRNQTRTLLGMKVEFTDENDPFITLNSVNKLLIQNNDSVTSITKETLVLNEMESRLRENPMVRNAEVFVTVDGRLGATIEQRNPIARIAGSPNYYLDEDGKKMPLSKVYTARVPLITGHSKNNFAELTPLILKLRDDEFMNQSVVGIHLERSGMAVLKMRKMEFDVRMGTPTDLERKFQNFKAFYQKAKKDQRLNEYKSVTLEFGNQVVATKK